MWYFFSNTGDGTNDVGALKAAHVGVALLDATEDEVEKLAQKQRIQAQQKMLEKQQELRKRWNIDDSPGMDVRKRKEQEFKEKLEGMLHEIGDDVPILKFGDASGLILLT